MSYVNSVTVYPSSATITKGKWYYDAWASISSDRPECAEVRWYSNNSSIASVNATTGYIYGVNTGTTRVYAEATDGSGKKDYITVTVTAPVSVTGVSVCPTSMSMDVGCTDYLYETIYPSNATNQTVTWCSSDDSVAEVNTYSGFVRAKKAGIATITACTVDGGYSASCMVTVNYCGGSNYRDVTKHSMVLCDDGYYVCTRCGYRVKSPALQDKEILNKSDYLAIASLYHEYLTIVEQNPIYAEKLLAMIDAIRGLTENKYKYDYCDLNGKYVAEYNVDFGTTRMYVNVNKGYCLSEWVLLNTLLPLMEAMMPFPYSFMFSVVSDSLLQEHPGAEGFTGSEILVEYAFSLAEQIKLIPKSVAAAASIYFAHNDIISGTSCTSECYNVNIVMMNEEEAYDLHQIKYHFSDGVETLGRHSEYKLDGVNNTVRSVDYFDNVNNREYTVHTW